MRFTLRSVVAVALSTNVALATPFITSLKCLNFRNILQSYPRDDVINMGKEILCSNQNCNPTVASWDRGGRDFLVSAIETEATGMGVPDLKDSAVTFMDSMWEMGKERCGFNEMTGQGVCNDPSQADAALACLQSNGWRVALSNIRVILPLLTSHNCETGMGYIANPQTLEETVPSYLCQFRDVCPDM